MPWSLGSISCPRISLDDDPVFFGNTVQIEILLRYTPPTKDELFPESPTLEWKEKIVMIDHSLRQRWDFETDMYQHRPLSRTLRIWTRRYADALRMHPTPLYRGTTRLYNGYLMPVHLPPQASAQLAAFEVRKYLAREGGILKVLLEDRPGLDCSPAAQSRNVERLLLVDVGVSGSQQRLQWAQWLRLDQTQLRGNWRRKCETSWFIPNLAPEGQYNTVSPPQQISVTTAPIVSPGEYL